MTYKNQSSTLPGKSQSSYASSPVLGFGFPLTHYKLVDNVGQMEHIVHRIHKSDDRLLSLQEIIELLQQGYLLIANVNARMLNSRPGYVGHFVVIKGADDRHLIVHDPGLPAVANRKILHTEFQKAWDYPDQNARNVMAIRPASGAAA